VVDAISREVVSSVHPECVEPARVARDFRRLLDGDAELRPAGSAKRRPRVLLERGYVPRYRFRLFDTTFYLTDVRQNPDIRFFVTYLQRDGERYVYPRIFYKDVSLIWRSASHFIRTAGENWIGKGDLKVEVVDGEELEVSAEETTDLPFEIQGALEDLVRRAKRIAADEEAVPLILRRGPADRLEAYEDFRGPRRRAHADPRNHINRDRRIARFSRLGDPASLRFAKGYEPDFTKRGILERSTSVSRLYGGRLRRFRILSRNREVQYLFFAGPRQVWIIPAQATTTELSSYGVRTVDVPADDDLFVPGYEYHYLDESVEPPEWVSQIPAGFVGAPSEVDDSRADASPWLERLPVIREFRRKVLKNR
jgi:hypothetical protein